MPFICYPKCTTGQRSKKWPNGHGSLYLYKERNIKLEDPSAEELAAWYEKSGLPLRKFFNTSGLLYKSMALKDRLPDMSEEEQLALLATDGMPVKRPLPVAEDRVLVGSRETQYARFAE